MVNKRHKKINNYLEETTFSFDNSIDKDMTKLIVKNSIETFIINEYKVNKNVKASVGIITNEEGKEEEAYYILLDLDIYNDEMRENNIDIEKMNDKLFEIYKNALKTEFLKDLNIENYKDEEIINI